MKRFIKRFSIIIKMSIDYFTPQEHLLFGSTPVGDYDSFYIPLAIQQNKASISEVDSLRRDNLTFNIFGINCIDENGNRFMSPVNTLLAPLDSEGKTLYDPRPVDVRIRIDPSLSEKYKMRS